MTKIFLILFVLLVCSSLDIGKAEESEEKTETTENTNSEDDEEESDSIQVVQRDAGASKVGNSLIKYDDNPQGEENYTTVPNDTNLTKTKYDSFFEDIISDSVDNISSENQDDDNDEVSSPAVTFITENNEDSNGQGKIDIGREDVTRPYDKDEKSKEESTTDEDEHDWRSAEHSGDKNVNEAANEESVEDEKGDSVEDFRDKKVDLKVKERMDTRQPERRQYVNARSMNFGHYRPPEEHDPGVMRRFNEMMVPRYRPVLTRNGIVYTPTLIPMQTGPSLLERLADRNWAPSRFHMNREPEVYKPRHNRVIGVPQYEDSKMMDDYNDYGPNTNTYSYTPVRKVTTQAPPQQIAAPNKFDVFQKLVEASNHPKAQKRPYNDFPGNYQPQRQYPENYASYNVRRVRRNAWDEPPF